MAVTPTGMLSAPLGTLRTLLSTLSSVQTWMGVASDAAALAKIHVNQFDEPDGQAGTPEWKTAAAAERPLIIIGTSEMLSDELTTSPYWPKTGGVWCEFQEIAQNENGVETSGNEVASTDAIYHLMNDVGAIVEAVEDAVSSGGTIDLLGWDIMEQAGRTKDEAVPGGNLDICGMVISFRRRDS